MSRVCSGSCSFVMLSDQCRTFKCHFLALQIMPKPIDGRSTGFVVGKLSHLSGEETFFVANYIHIVYDVGPQLGMNSFWITLIRGLSLIQLQRVHALAWSWLQLRLDWSDGDVGSISMVMGVFWQGELVSWFGDGPFAIWLLFRPTFTLHVRIGDWGNFRHCAQLLKAWG